MLAGEARGSYVCRQEKLQLKGLAVPESAPTGAEPPGARPQRRHPQQRIDEVFAKMQAAQ